MGYIIGYCVAGFVIIFAIIIAIVAQHKVNSAYGAYRDIPSSLGLTGAQLAERLSQENNLNLTVKMCKGTLTDHYNPKDKSINISEGNFSSNSIAAQSIVAHEFGHALQHAQGYGLYKVRQAIVKISNFVSGMLLPLLIVGILLEIFLLAGAGSIVIYVTVAMYGLAVIANLATLPVEVNASSRAKKILYKMGCTSEDEVYATDKMLNAAALTYVASLLVSLAYFLRFLFFLLAVTRND